MAEEGHFSAIDANSHKTQASTSHYIQIGHNQTLNDNIASKGAVGKVSI